MTNKTRKGTVMNVEIAQRLAELRRERGFSQEGLAEQLGLSRQAVSKWERAESAPDMGNLIALADLYEVTLDELLRVSPEVADDVRFESQERAESVETEAAAAAEAALAAAARAEAAAATAAEAPEAPKVVVEVSAPGHRPPSAGYGPGVLPHGSPASPQSPGACPPGSCPPGSIPPASSVPIAPPPTPQPKDPLQSFPYPLLCAVIFLRLLLRLVAPGLGHLSHHSLLLLGGEHLGGRPVLPSLVGRTPGCRGEKRFLLRRGCPMRLERSTYVKIALIVLLCLGVCGFFGGCRGIVPGGGSLFAPGGLMGCVGWNAMGEIAGYAGDAVGEMADYAGDAASEVADATLHSGVRGGVAATNEGSHFEIDASEVNAIDLNWLAGSGSVRVVPDSETGGAIVVNETMHGGPQPVMACSTNDGVLSIDYMEGSGGLSGCSLGTWGSKDVELLIPESAASLERFVLEAASGEYGIDGADAVLCGKMELDVASGSVSVSRTSVTDLELSLASGNVAYEGSVAKTLRIDQASGEFRLGQCSPAPETIAGSLASGHIILELPADTALKANVNKTSGNFTNDFAESAGDSSQPCDLSFDIISGNLEVLGVE